MLFGKLLKSCLFSKTKGREGKLWEQEQSEQALRRCLEGRATARGQRRARVSPALAAARLINKPKIIFPTVAVSLYKSIYNVSQLQIISFHISKLTSLQKKVTEYSTITLFMTINSIFKYS